MSYNEFGMTYMDTRYRTCYTGAIPNVKEELQNEKKNLWGSQSRPGNDIRKRYMSNKRAK